YSYGQRLTAVDLLDEQSYLVGKDRFVARHVLGAGILCGLRASRGDGPPDRTPTIRVTRGAALDLCGRAIVVEHDQCLDVAAWFARRRDELSWSDPGTYPAWIGLRYGECPSDPIRVPGDPCGCDGGGCVYTRVHESFELALHAADGPVDPAKAPPSWDELCHGLAEHPSAVPLAPESCPPCSCEEWLLVATVDVTLDRPAGGAGLRAVDVGAPVEGDPRRLTLHSLAALQHVVTSLGAADCEPGPAISGLEGDGDLAADGSPVPLAAATVDADRLSLLRVGAAGWEAVDSSVTYDDGAAAFELKTDAAELARPYRLVLQDDPARPTVDEQLRPLRPSVFSRGVRWVAIPPPPGSGDPATVTLVTGA